MRAAAIRIDDVNGVGGFVLPGDFVDVLVTRPEGENTGQLRTDLLLQGVRVLAVDQLANANKTDPVVAKAATVELTPHQAQKLALARQTGVLSLSLRGTADPIAPVAVGAIRSADLGGGYGPAQAAPARVMRVAAAPARPKGPQIQVYRGGGEAALVPVRSE